jgi:hypothetical protein
LSHQGGCRFSGSRYAFGRISRLEQTHLIGIHKIDGFFFTEFNTLRFAVTEVAFEDLFIYSIKAHCAEGANANTRATANADIVVNVNPAHILIARDGLYRADIQTGRILTLLTGHGYVKTLSLPFDHSDPASGRIGFSIMRNSAHKLTQLTARTFLMIDI